MRPNQSSLNDRNYAHSLAVEPLDHAWTSTEIRERAEQMLMHCDPESPRYAFWRLVLAITVAETNRTARPRYDKLATSAA
jgi:hypothetical protein